MDSQKFDSLVKTLASPTSRRRVVKGAAAVGAGGLLTLFGSQRSEALQCPNGKKPCAGRCIKNGHDCDKGDGRPTGEPHGQAVKD
jgi:hypothetical protein